MKTCTICKESKSHDNFTKDKKTKDGFYPWCKPCKSDRYKNYYDTDARKERGKVHRAKKLERILDYLSEHPCVDCGEDDILVLEFDHRDGRDNPFDGVTAKLQSSWEVILKEIAKCDVRCSNCHVRVTHKRANSPRYRYIAKTA